MRPLPDDPAAGPASITAAEGSAPVAAAADPTPVAAVPPVSSPASDPVAAVAASLASGALDAAAATQRLVHDAVAAQLPRGLSPAAHAALEREVSALLAGDPTMADLLAPL